MVPILTYHAMRICDNEYEGNDLVALAHDLESLAERRIEVLPVAGIIDSWLADPRAFDGRRVVGLTCDDGSDFDYRDIEHPTCGMQRSILNVLRDAGRGAHITSFVIVSPQARRELDRTCMVGRGWWNDDWWPHAVASGLMHIANHSWDHNHDSLPQDGSFRMERGTFTSIDTPALAHHEIGRAVEFLHETAPNPGEGLFAYPYGKGSDYLLEEYFPRFGSQLGLRAAFGDLPQPLSPDSYRWNVPRFVHGRDWRSRDDFEKLLDDLLH